ncbi:MAG TPA: phosphoribosylformylglycinamidine synthase subunit PurS [Firmicutes bacterium]|jgi:phosphoribosylformylglycinamidine synthase PurS subunit|nr:phosphoribosylformylglycinamidine synthase subunit PurS [Bacillota bacterium]
MWKAEIHVTLKDAVLDPQGKAVRSVLGSLGYSAVEKVRIGKYLEMVLNVDSRAEAERQLDEICHRVLANPVIEQYDYQLVEVPR